MKRLFEKTMFYLLFALLLSSVDSQYFNSWLSNGASWNSVQNPNRLLVRGNLLSDDQSILPYGSQIIVSVVDASLQDAPSRPINTFVLYGSYQFPISYEIPLTSMINSNQLQRLSIEARIERDGRLLYINDEYTPVRFSSMPINIRMKNVGNSNGFLSSSPPTIINPFICQLRPDPGPCYAYNQQFYYNSQWRRCFTFVWGGCGGNENRFRSVEDCERACSPYRRRINSKYK